MNYKKYSPLLLLLTLCFAACAQQKQGIRKVQLFSRVQIPGNIPVNDKGEPLMGPDTVYTIVAETTGRNIHWLTAYTKDKSYSVSATLISHLPFDAGVDNSTGKKILLAPAKGNQLWLLQLSPVEAKTAHIPKPANGGILLLQGKIGGTEFSSTIQQQTTLQTIPVY